MPFSFALAISSETRALQSDTDSTVRTFTGGTSAVDFGVITVGERQESDSLKLLFFEDSFQKRGTFNPFGAEEGAKSREEILHGFITVFTEQV